MTSFFKLNSINQSRFIYVSILIIVAFCSLDRLVTVFKPFNFLFKNKLKFQLPGLSVTLIIILSFVIPGTYFNVQEIVNNQTTCTFPNEPEYLWLFSYIQKQVILFRTVIPLIIMVISSYLIFWKIKKNTRNLRVLNANQKKDYQMGIVY